VTGVNILELIQDALKLKDELVVIGKKIDESIKSEKDRKRRKKLKKASKKVLKSGKVEDLATLRKLMFPYARIE